MTIDPALPVVGGSVDTWGSIENTALTDVVTAYNSHVTGTDPHGDRAYADTNKLDKSQNLGDVSNAATARTNLGLGTAAQSDTSDFMSPAAVAAAIAAAVTTNRLVNL
ncbi:MAG: hypothetical protein KGL35_11215 [Bradyrhizobium sp.]|nr:hypothetical protein [Bradyrhizobium sp.]